MKEYAQRTSCPNWVADQTLQSQLYHSQLRREHPGWNTSWCQEWGLFQLEYLLHNAASMRRKDCQRHFQALQAETAKVTAPGHPSVRTLLGTTDIEILKVVVQVYQVEYMMAPSELPCQQQQECIKELHLELALCVARAGLQSRPGPARPTSQSRGCSHSQAQPPSAESQGAEVAKHPREILQLSNQDQGGDVPIPGVRTSHKDTGVPYHNIQAAASLPLPAPHDHVLLTRCSGAP